MSKSFVGGEAERSSPPLSVDRQSSPDDADAPATHRSPGILKTRDLFKLASSGPRFTTDAFTMQRRLPREGESLGETRFGITVTKRSFAKAVTRNRIRRRFRAAIIASAPNLPAGSHDFVLVAREAAVGIDFAMLTADIVRAAATLAKRDRPARPRSTNRGEKPQNP